MTQKGQTQRDWKPIFAKAKAFVLAHPEGVTLRQCFYHLVASGDLRNTPKDYDYLGERTIPGRMDGSFPEFIEHGRQVIENEVWASPHDALADLAGFYRRDRTEGQPYNLILGVEKLGITQQLSVWFGDLGIPIVPMSGSASYTLMSKLEQRAQADPRETILIYMGDLDATGWNIGLNDLPKRLPSITVERIGLTETQVAQYGLTVYDGKPKDPNAARFMAAHPGMALVGGIPGQVELDALDPNDLRDLYQKAIDQYWDASAGKHALAQEALDIAALRGAKL